MRPSWTASAAFAISISFRTAASGSLNGLGSANFTGFVLGWHVLTACRIFDGASVNRARKLGPGLPVHAGGFLLLNCLFSALLASIVISRGKRRGEGYSEVG